jgi:hypothetical protein
VPKIREASTRAAPTTPERDVAAGTTPAAS